METPISSQPRGHGHTVAIWLVIASIASVQVGSALGKGAFGTISPTGLTWLRLIASAIFVVALVRPRLRGHTRQDWLLVATFGGTLALMNWSFYQAIAQIPIGVAVTIEFLGPLSVAVWGSRRPRDLIWVGLAFVGVALLGLSPGRLTWAGVGFALLAAVLWAAYIPLSANTGQRWSGLEGLAAASVIAALLLTPAALATAGSALLEPRILLLGAAIGLLSSAIPYSLELIALRSLPNGLFGILMSLEPAAAALAAAIILGELLTGWQLLAMTCVVMASVGATRSAALGSTAKL